jgi:predicted metal-dependent phosphoesterase TrpH
MTIEPLLCELHAHSTWSDGALTVPELVDLYGRAGFDVLAVTDHTTRDLSAHVGESSFAAYLTQIETEAERAERTYGLLVVPGLELTYDDPDPRRAAHALAIGLRTFTGVSDSLDEALTGARDAGAALVAAHPYPVAEARQAPRGTGRWAAEPEWAAEAVHRFELFNRHDVFAWVGRDRLPVIASGDFHRLEHLHTWKTLLHCAREEEAVVELLRSARPVSLTLHERFPARRAAA